MTALHDTWSVGTGAVDLDFSSIDIMDNNNYGIGTSKFQIDPSDLSDADLLKILRHALENNLLNINFDENNIDVPLIMYKTVFDKLPLKEQIDINRKGNVRLI